MTCPIQHDAITAFSPARPETVNPAAAKAVEQFEQVTGSILVGLFAVGFFDQTMLPEISAALTDTRRIRDEPWERAFRSGASDQLLLHGAADDSQAEADRLRQMHRVVKGLSPDGVRYSALNPDSWNWVLYSTFFMHHGAYIALTGNTPSDEENQAIWDHFRAKAEGLQLPGRSRLIESYVDVVAHYDRFAAERLAVTQLLQDAIQQITAPPRPPFLPAVTEPLWRLTAPLISHVAVVLGEGIMHPSVRKNMPGEWTSINEAEFAIMTTALRIAFAVLPSRLTDTPMTRNRKQYRKLASQYQGMGLKSFAPGAA